MVCTRETCGLVFFGIVGGIALIVLIANRAAIVPVYNFGKEFEMATCRVGSVDYTPTDLPCKFCYSTSTRTCTEYHTSRSRSHRRECRTISRQKCRLTEFPCLMINITYDFGDGVWNEALLHYDQAHLSAEPRCSYQICKESSSYSRKIVEDYARKFRSMKADEEFTCFVNPSRDDDAIETKKYTKSDVMHGTLWPAVVLSVCIVAMLVIGVWKYRQSQKSKENKEAKIVKKEGESVPLNSGVTAPPPVQPPPPGYTPTAQPYVQPAGYPYPQPGMPPPQQLPYGAPPPQGYPQPQPGYYPPPQGAPPVGGYPPPQGGAYPPPQGGPYPPAQPGAQPYPQPQPPFEESANKV